MAFADALLERIHALPGVQSVGITHAMPLVGDYVLASPLRGGPRSPRAIGRARITTRSRPIISPPWASGWCVVGFLPSVITPAPRVAIINDTFARQFFPNEDPIGKRIDINNGPDGSWREIVGIVGDIKQYGVDKTTSAQSYEPFAQNPFSSMNVVIRSSGSAAALLGALRPAEVTPWIKINRCARSAA